MTALWPPELPQEALLGAQEVRPDNVLRTAMDVGPAKLRSRQTAPQGRFQRQFLLTAIEAAKLVEFYEATLTFGTLPFDWKNLRTGAVETYRFLAPPQLSQMNSRQVPAAGALVRASCQLENTPLVGLVTVGTPQIITLINTVDKFSEASVISLLLRSFGRSATNVYTELETIRYDIPFSSFSGAVGAAFSCTWLLSFGVGDTIQFDWASTNLGSYTINLASRLPAGTPAVGDTLVQPPLASPNYVKTLILGSTHRLYSQAQIVPSNEDELCSGGTPNSAGYGMVSDFQTIDAHVAAPDLRSTGGRGYDVVCVV